MLAETRIVGIGESRVGKVPDRSALQLQSDAAHAALADAGLTLADIDGLITTPVRVEPWIVVTGAGTLLVVGCGTALLQPAFRTLEERLRAEAARPD